MVLTLRRTRTGFMVRVAGWARSSDRIGSGFRSHYRSGVRYFARVHYGFLSRSVDWVHYSRTGTVDYEGSLPVMGTVSEQGSFAV